MYISADPGVANFGISVIDPSDHFKVIETFLVKNARKFTDDEKVVEAIYGGRTVKVLSITAKLEELLDKYPEVNSIVLEAPFYNALTPVAYGSLLEVIMAIKYTIVLKRNILFKLIEPLLVKKFFSNKPMASKEIMRQFLISRKADGTVDLSVEVESLSEHEIDAIAVGFTHYLTLKEQTQTQG